MEEEGRPLHLGTQSHARSASYVSKLVNHVQYASSRRSSCSVVSLEWAGPGVGGGIVFPLSVSVSLAFELLLSDVFISVGNSVLLLDGTSRGGGDEGEDNGNEFHC